MKTHHLYKIFLTTLITLASAITGCKKFVTVNELSDNLLASQVFNNESTANSAIAGIYETMQLNTQQSSDITILTGLSGDELKTYDGAFNINYSNDAILSNDGALPWSELYNVIYQCNAAIEGLNQSILPAPVKNQLLGEATFLRAYNYFYLVNLFGDVPLITSTNVNVTARAARTPVANVYQSIIQDLLRAQDLLGTTNNYANGEKTRATKWVATALLSRVYLYQKDWVNASKYSGDIIASNTFTLDPNLSDVFNKNSSESILQLENNPTLVIAEAQDFIYQTSPIIVCTDSLINSFENGDQRKTQWIQSMVYSGATVYYPFKYTSINPNPPQYYTLFRLAEQYLIRAEAYAQQNMLPAAIADLNLIRQRAGLNPLASSLSQAGCLAAIQHERRVELFAEVGHRWFDLKRTGTIDTVMNTEKPGIWKPNAALWPIPLADIHADVNLTQNPGY